MIQEIPISRIAAYTHVFPDPQAGLALASIAAGNTRAQLWRVGQPRGDALLLWDKGNNVFYLGGNPLAGGALDAVADFIGATIKESAIQEKRPYFRARALLQASHPILPRLFRGVELGQTNKLFYAYRRPTPPAMAPPARAGVQFAVIDAAFLRREYLHNLPAVRTEIAAMWPSPERFCQQGFGIAALLEETIIGWCTAEYVSESQCGIGIATIAAFENKGIATATAARFVAGCLQRGLRPHWECDEKNIGSVRVAEKVGFEKIQTAAFWVGLFQ